MESASIAENRRARFDYNIRDTFEAGIELQGHEVKSAKGGRFQIAGAHALVRGGEAWLLESHIPPYQKGNTPADYEDGRARRLLLTKDEIRRIHGALIDRSARLIPLRAYLKHGLIKIELGLAHSRRAADKRDALKKRAHQREMRQGE